MSTSAWLDRPARRLVALLARPPVFLGVMAAYYVLLGAISVLLFTGASIDTTEQMMFAQSWALRYDDANPPLFSWLVKLAELVVGPGIAAVTLVKFGCLWAVHGFLFALGRMLRLAPALTVLLGLSPLTLYYLAWDAIYTYSHSLLLSAACGAAVWAVARVLERPSWDRYAMLGVILGIGLLAKYNFAVFALGLLAALALNLGRRRARIWVGLALCLVPTVPALALLAVEAEQLAAVAGGRLSVQAETDIIAAAGLLLPQALEAVWQLLLPMLPLYVVVFWPALLRRPERPVPDITLFLGVALAITAVLMLLGLLAVHATTVRTPYVFMFFLVPVVLYLRLAGYPRLDRAVRLFVLVPLGLMLVVPVGLAVKAQVEAQNCRRCFLAFDYAALADGLRHQGFQRGTIVGRLDAQGRVGGLRPYFPDSRLISLRYPHFVPPAPAGRGSGQCALLWYAGGGTDAGGESPASFVEGALATPVPADAEVVDLAVPLAGDRDPIVIKARLWTPTTGQCI